MTFELRLKFDGEDQNLSWSIFGKLPLSHKQWCWWRSWRRWEGGWRWPTLPFQEARSLRPLSPYSGDERTLSLGHEQSPFQPAGVFANNYLANQPSGFCLGHNPLTFIFIKLIHAPIVTDKQTIIPFLFPERPKARFTSSPIASVVEFTARGESSYKTCRKKQVNVTLESKMLKHSDPTLSTA